MCSVKKNFWPNGKNLKKMDFLNEGFIRHASGMVLLFQQIFIVNSLAALGLASNLSQ
jgi:hypothetical protein